MEPGDGFDKGFKELYEMDKILGLDLAKWEEVELSDREKQLVDDRQQARAEKNFKRADEIRNILEKGGIILEDTPEGIRYRRK